MPFHRNSKRCLLCEEKIEMGHPLLKLYWAILKDEFTDLHISWCFRGESDQRFVFSQGKSKKQWPNSKHNHMIDDKPCSLALDLFKLTNNNKALFPPKYYYDIDQFITDNDMPLYWSGKWNGFKELDHYELILSGAQEDEE